MASVTNYAALLSDVKIRSSIDGEEWYATKDGELVCKAPSKSILEMKAADILGDYCHCRSNRGYNDENRKSVFKIRNKK